MGMPCITSDLANNAIVAVPGESILIGHEPEEYAEHILNLLDNPGEQKRLARNGHDFVKQTFDWDRAAERLEKVMVNTPRPPAPEA